VEDAPVAAHIPVLLAEAVDALDVRPGGLYLDGTFGAGGHTREIAARGGRVVAFDVDSEARLPPELAGTVQLVHANFADLAAQLDELELGALDGVLFDLGVSSMQFDRGERGFSFQDDGPLDMRLDRSSGQSALDLLATLDERELADTIFEFGEERASRRIARAIVAAREAGELPVTTAPFARLVARAIHVRGYQRIHPATRTFQALRIAVNDELGALRGGLAAATERLRAGGRLAVISFHSLEDRIVKQTFRDDPRLRALTKKPLAPGEAEVARNPRARSAKLRVAERAE
jgi:16S rRNA (cytosine1402-N4)-methyltransferase